MTRTRDSWLDERPVCVVPDDGDGVEKLVCMDCESEWADRAAFIGHECENYRKGPELMLDATDAAREMATEHGIELVAVEGTGKDGRITKADVESAVGGN